MLRASSRRPALLVAASAVAAAAALLLAAVALDTAHAQSMPSPLRPPAATYAAGTGPGEFRSPEGVFLYDSGRIVVADTGNHRIQVFHPNGTFAYAIGGPEPGTGPGEFRSPVGVHVGGRDEILVADTGNHRVQVFHINGTFVFQFGTNGTGPGELSSPASVTYDWVYSEFMVADTGNNRIQVFRPNGSFAAQFALHDIPRDGLDAGQNFSRYGNLSGPTGAMHLDGSPVVAVADTGNDRIVNFIHEPIADRRPISLVRSQPTLGSYGTGDLEFDGLRSIDVSHGNNIIVADTGNHRVQALNVGSGGIHYFSLGSHGTGPGEFSSPAAASWAIDGAFAVADTGNHRVQVFHQNRTLNFILGLPGNGTDGDGGGGGTPTDGDGGGGGTPTDGDGGGGTCSISLASASLDVRAAPGSASSPAVQVLTNAGSLDLAGVVVSVTPWYVDPVGAPPHGAGHAALPLTLTELSTAGPAVPRSFIAMSADGTAPLAVGLPPGNSSSLWFRINLDGLTGLTGNGQLVQYTTYLAECAVAPPLA